MTVTDSPPRPPRSTWRTAARDLFGEVRAACPALSAAALADLYAACDFLDAAEAMQRTINAHGVIVTGSQGQPVAHPLIAEVRHYRREAFLLLRSLEQGQRPTSAAGAALANKRWSSRRGAFVGVRAVPPPR